RRRERVVSAGAESDPGESAIRAASPFVARVQAPVAATRRGNDGRAGQRVGGVVRVLSAAGDGVDGGRRDRGVADSIGVHGRELWRCTERLPRDAGHTDSGTPVRTG